jgi:L-arabinose isomerase
LARPAVAKRIGTWARAAAGLQEAQTLSVARFGDNMRQVAVTEGDKVEMEMRLGVSVNGYGAGDLAMPSAPLPIRRPARPRRSLPARPERGRGRASKRRAAEAAGRTCGLAGETGPRHCSRGVADRRRPHHTVCSQALVTEAFEDLAEMAGIELLVIDERTRISDVKKELRWNDVYHRLS